MIQFERLLAGMLESDQQASGESVQEVFALFGLAVYQANVLERGLAQLLVRAWQPAGIRWTPEAFDAALAERSRRTLGQLMNEPGMARAKAAGTDVGRPPGSKDRRKRKRAGYLLRWVQRRDA